LKPEWWGSPLVQEEKYQEKPVKREEEIIVKIIIIIIIIIAVFRNGILQELGISSTPITTEQRCMFNNFSKPSTIVSRADVSVHSAGY
jgi:hypothetical protein